MAWLVAFNDGHFNERKPGDLGPLLAGLCERAADGELELGDERERWSDAVSGWLQEGPKGDDAQKDVTEKQDAEGIEAQQDEAKQDKAEGGVTNKDETEGDESQGDKK
jgi:hypothetical protein